MKTMIEEKNKIKVHHKIRRIKVPDNFGKAGKPQRETRLKRLDMSDKIPTD